MSTLLKVLRKVFHSLCKINLGTKKTAQKKVEFRKTSYFKEIGCEKFFFGVYSQEDCTPAISVQLKYFDSEMPIKKRTVSRKSRFPRRLVLFRVEKFQRNYFGNIILRKSGCNAVKSFAGPLNHFILLPHHRSRPITPDPALQRPSYRANMRSYYKRGGFVAI